MKINIDVDDSRSEDMITIHCHAITEEILELQRILSKQHLGSTKIAVFMDDTEYYVDLNSIIFLESDGNYISVHTDQSIYRIRKTLYELEEVLPRDFMRVSKSTIVNTALITSIRKNITGASEISFRESSKHAFASRTYIKALMDFMNEKRLRK